MPTTLSDRVSIFATIVLALCAATVVGFGVYDRVGASPPPPPSSEKIVSEQADWESFDVNGNVIGDSMAPVRVVIFSDFECPYCRAMSTRLLDAQRRSGGLIRIRHRHFPLTRIHPRAYDFAVASECAARQDHFAEASNALFAMGATSASAVIADSARLLGVPDAMAFRECLSDTLAATRVKTDVVAARKLGVRGTPVTLIGSIRVDGSIPQSRLDSLLSIATKTFATAKR